MRAPFAVALVLLLSGCLGGCYPASYQLAWTQPELVALVPGLANATLVVRSIAPSAGIGDDLAPPPEAEGAWNLTAASLAWDDDEGAEVSRDRTGAVRFLAHVDHGRYPGQVEKWLGAAVQALTDATAAERDAIVANAMRDFDDRANRIVIRLEAPLGEIWPPSGWAAEPVLWATPTAIGERSAQAGDVTLHYRLQTWSVQEHGKTLLEVDAGGFALGPAVRPPGNANERLQPDLDALRQTTASTLARLGLPATAFGAASPVVASMVCAD